MFEIAWRLIKPFVSQETHSKLNFLGSDVKNWKTELLKIMKADQFPQKYGGELPDNKEVPILISHLRDSDKENANEPNSLNLPIIGKPTTTTMMKRLKL